MNRLNYIIKSYRYFFRQHLYVIAGLILSSMVLSGALIVGDSVKASLNSLVEVRLGSITHAMPMGDRFVSDSLAIRMNAKENTKFSSVLSIYGMLVNPDKNKKLPKIKVLGVDEFFWQFKEIEVESPVNNNVFVSENIASRLNVDVGDEILLKVENIALVPINTPFAEEKSNVRSFRVLVEKILKKDNFGAFSLRSDQKAPFNLFISKEYLQKKLKLGKRSNLMVADFSQEKDVQEYLLAKNWSYKDASLKLNQSKDSIFKITSDRVFIDNAISEKLIEEYNANSSLTYLVNAISYKERSTPYSFVSGIEDKSLHPILKNDGIIINSWCAKDLELEIGDSVNLSYWVMGAYRQLEEKHYSFIVNDIQLNNGSLFSKEMMPDFPGLADAKSCSEWDAGVPIDLEKIRGKDEKYWEDYRGTPKAIISYKKAKELWSNVYGASTSLSIKSISDSKFEKDLSSKIDPRLIGLEFMTVKNIGEKAAKNGVDFGELFLSLSFFVIVSALLLLIMLLAMNLLLRQNEIITLQKLGLSEKWIFKTFLAEYSIDILLATLLGSILGIFYNKAILSFLNTLWYDAVRTDSLMVFVKPRTLGIAFIISALISFIVVYFVIRKQMKNDVQGLSHTSTSTSIFEKILNVLAILILFVVLAFLTYYFIFNPIISSSMFMLLGALMLFVLLMFFRYILQMPVMDRTDNYANTSSFIIKNIKRNPSRNFIAVTLMAIGTFSVLLTGLNRKTFAGYELIRNSGTGGFDYWIESTLPFIHDPNLTKGKEVYNIEGIQLMDSVHFIPFLQLEGDDASCLNLNQVENPGLLGFDSKEFNTVGAFTFKKLLDQINPDSPWLELDKKYGKNSIPAYIDETVLTWGIMKKVGDTLVYLDEKGDDLNVIIAGTINNTIFQGHVLISDKNMRTFFPSVAGAKILLAELNGVKKESFEEVLNNNLSDMGLSYQRSSERLRNFNSVTNTYLDIFLLLGALALLIGTIGFGIILFRNRLERRKEVAILQAIGIPDKRISMLFIKEHFILLLAGIVIAIISASLASIPTLIQSSLELPYKFIVSILILVLLSGVFWIIISAVISKGENLNKLLHEE